MVNYYDDLISRIGEYGKGREEKQIETDAKIAAVKQELEQAEKDVAAALDSGDAVSYGEKVNICNMKKAQLDRLNKAMESFTVKPVMSAAEHSAFRKELRDHMTGEAETAYKKLLSLLDEGETVIREYQEAIKKYYRAYEILDSKVADFEADDSGARYEKFASCDTMGVKGAILDVFCNDSIGSVKQIIQHCIELGNYR